MKAISKSRLKSLKNKGRVVSKEPAALTMSNKQAVDALQTTLTGFLRQILSDAITPEIMNRQVVADTGYAIKQPAASPQNQEYINPSLYRETPRNVEKIHELVFTRNQRGFIERAESEDGKNVIEINRDANGFINSITSNGNNFDVDRNERGYITKISMAS